MLLPKFFNFNKLSVIRPFTRVTQEGAELRRESVDFFDDMFGSDAFHPETQENCDRESFKELLMERLLDDTLGRIDGLTILTYDDIAKVAKEAGFEIKDYPDLAQALTTGSALSLNYKSNNAEINHTTIGKSTQITEAFKCG